MTERYETIRQDTITLLQQVAEDWDYDEPITEDTYLVADLGFESLDVVILGTKMQDHYGHVLPFNDLFAEIGQREIKDLTLGEWVSFIDRHLPAASP